jgi:uncharacterized protein YecT (DUF1311 family)
MTRNSPILAIALLVLWSTAAAAKDCEKEDNWSAVRACAEEQQTAHLEAVYRDTLAYVRKDNPDAAQWLEKAQAAWLDFAEKSCEFTVASRDPGSNDLRFGCWQTFTQAREKVLLAYKRDHGKPPQNQFQP